MVVQTIRNFGKVQDAVEIPDLVAVQRSSYDRFLQKDTPRAKREDIGLEALFREIFPIESYDKKMTLEYLSYELEKPHYTPLECRQLRLTYAYPLKIHCRLRSESGADLTEQAIYLGEMPVMVGGGEFIVNGAVRVIVNQLHRSPGVDFLIESKEGDRVLHGGRVIPERGSWIEISVTQKDILVVKIDQSSKIPATVFLRAISPDLGATEDIIRLFYPTKSVAAGKLSPEMWAVGPIVDTETGEIIVEAGAQISDKVSLIQQSSIKKVEVIEQVRDAIVLNTLAEDDCESHEQALLKFYVRLRPGNPPNQEKAQAFFAEKFFDANRYRLGKVGRFRLNRKFGQSVAEDEMTLRPEDFINTMKYMLALRNNEGEIDDIDHLGNRRLRTIDELAADEIRKGLLKLRRTAQERMSIKRDAEEAPRVADLVNSKSVASSINYFFGRGELSQVVDQTNALSQLTHERRLSALGPGGLNRRRAGFEVRDVHISHYGRICPIETPEGTNIGLISSLSIFTTIDDYGFLLSPYRRVKNGKLTGEVEYLRADEEMRAVFAPPSTVDFRTQKIEDEMVLARRSGELTQTQREEVDYVDVSPKQIVGVSASLIPFLEHDDANRALMGSNMQRQAVPLLYTQPPVVGTGMESVAARDSGALVTARRAGTVVEVDSRRVVVRADGDEYDFDRDDIYELKKFQRSNQDTCINQKPIVNPGQRVDEGTILADGMATSEGKLALGVNAIVAFTPWNGYNYEDAVVVSERMVKEDLFTSVHIEEYEVNFRETKLGPEELLRDIPNVGEDRKRNLDENGVIRVGARVRADDILVGKVSPKGEQDLSPAERLIRAIFGQKAGDVKDTSLRAPNGMDGTVVDVKVYSRRDDTERGRRVLEERVDALREQKLSREQRLCNERDEKLQAVLAGEKAVNLIDSVTGEQYVPTGRKLTTASLRKVNFTDLDYGRQLVEDLKADDKARRILRSTSRELDRIQQEFVQAESRISVGDELKPGVIKLVKVYVAKRRKLRVGDKVAGRHGNKGIVSIIVAEEDMPYLPDGTPVDICLNPLGVPSRMNVGQIMEANLGWAAETIGFDALTPVFDSADNSTLEDTLEEAGLPRDGKTVLYDGRSGEPMAERVTVGFMYMMKLAHQVEDKIHARSTGPYAMVTQQPLGGKAQNGGQRLGEMEVWALEAYGAAHCLQEMLTIKSDDVEGRNRAYSSIVQGKAIPPSSTPESFNVLLNEMRSLALDVELVTEEEN